MYAYCANNPVNYVDPSGHVAITVITGVGLLVAGYAYIRYVSARPKKVKVTKRYTVSKSYWDTHSHATYMSMSIISYWFIKKVVNKPSKESHLSKSKKSLKKKINQSKGGKQNLRRSGGAKNRSEEVQDEKSSKTRNKQKRANMNKNSGKKKSPKQRELERKARRNKPKKTYD